jgi:hypothetical protein
MENHGGIISTGETPDSSTRALWESYQQSHIVANQVEPGEGNDECSLRSIFVHTSKWFFTCRKMLPHGANGFLSEGRCAVDFITLKINLLG